MHERTALVRLDTAKPVMDGEAGWRARKAIRPDATLTLSRGFHAAETVRRFAGTVLSGFIQKPYTSSRHIDKIKRTLENGHPASRTNA